MLKKGDNCRTFLFEDTPDRFFVRPSVRPSVPSWVGTWTLLQGQNRPEREVDYSHPSGVEVKNIWSYTSTPMLYILYLIVLNKVKRRANAARHVRSINSVGLNWKIVIKNSIKFRATVLRLCVLGTSKNKQVSESCEREHGEYAA
jgi:hypothetical protein